MVKFLLLFNTEDINRRNYNYNTKSKSWPGPLEAVQVPHATISGTLRLMWWSLMFSGGDNLRTHYELLLLSGRMGYTFIYIGMLVCHSVFKSKLDKQLSLKGPQEHNCIHKLYSQKPQNKNLLFQYFPKLSKCHSKQNSSEKRIN